MPKLSDFITISGQWPNLGSKLRSNKSLVNDWNKMQAPSESSSDDLVISHFCRQIFKALGYPDKETAILKKKWRVAVSVNAKLMVFLQHCLRTYQLIARQHPRGT